MTIIFAQIANLQTQIKRITLPSLVRTHVVCLDRSVFWSIVQVLLARLSYLPCANCCYKAGLVLSRTLVLQEKNWVKLINVVTEQMHPSKSQVRGACYRARPRVADKEMTPHPGDSHE